ncbi:MAG: Uma2 family endonuclease [Scytonema sp. PMC 1069.18]|nr:Uma2 family endonuclease [Scytonema sp. PMC 1069.18]MEC4883573.1 Uma2 family endonuclease [Scytonema sp. PMC 1070.18]
MVSFKELIEETSDSFTDDFEERLTISGVSWESYEKLLTKLEDNSHYRVTYLDEILEIVSPSQKHETVKSRIGFLLEFYFCKKGIKHTPMGSTTVKNRLKKVGAEPDECYCIGEKKDIPDLAIEVTITSGSIKKLETYRRLGVKEVWFWEDNQFKLFYLREGNSQSFPKTYGYEQIQSSELVPELNINFFTECVSVPDQVDAWRQFEQGI